MPNWCENQVNFMGPVKEVKEILELFFTEQENSDHDGIFLDFNKTAPLNSSKDDKGDAIWDYDLAIEKWGTKWAPNQSSGWTVSGNEHYMSVYGEFDTAWGPATGIHTVIQDYIDEKGYEIDLEWFFKEPGMRVCGWLPEEY